MSDLVFDSLEDLQREAYERGVRDEREACAKVCDEAWKETLVGADRASWNAAVKSCAADIRERSNAKVKGAE